MASVDCFSSQIEHIYSKSAKSKPSGNPVLKISFITLSIAVALGVSYIAPPPAKICGTLHGPAVTTSRLRFPDGRPVAYAERGVSKNDAKHKVVVVHEYGGTRLDLFPCNEEKLEELGVYMVSFDRAGYGESHPFPHRSIASEVQDMEHLADALELGPKFYVIAIGVGAYAGWGCIQYIPNRIAGLAMISPVANFWWPGLAATSQGLEALEAADRYTLQVAHYAPRFLYHYTRQKWFPSSNMEKLSQVSELAIQQGIHESIHRDLMIQFGSWEFDPAALHNPFVGDAVHVWQSSEDPFFPSSWKARLKIKLPWVQYHTIPGKARDSWLQVAGLPEKMLVSLLPGNQTHA
ncbi:uncharacterized protein LOC9660662 [Selaginella moellendorffii]|uniref:uncharacterized protein LOC9660662 n=1 Tax=Selaginella moellendorffii TaxID=88036 RepID=UPI000D1C9C6B|nr:uncharacterized protein LOC9660662 [Selaginella moellendorffii]|eukprot:XP_024529993.1 uncharacterized protein LOC9660662 [Selaginella moellendorffii]